MTASEFKVETLERLASFRGHSVFRDRDIAMKIARISAQSDDACLRAAIVAAREGVRFSREVGDPNAVRASRRELQALSSIR